jgi:hypothetical protein
MPSSNGYTGREIPYSDEYNLTPFGLNNFKDIELYKNKEKLKKLLEQKIYEDDRKRKEFTIEFKKEFGDKIKIIQKIIQEIEQKKVKQQTTEVEQKTTKVEQQQTTEVKQQTKKQQTSNDDSARSAASTPVKTKTSSKK